MGSFSSAGCVIYRKTSRSCSFLQWQHAQRLLSVLPELCVGPADPGGVERPLISAPHNLYLIYHSRTYNWAFGGMCCYCRKPKKPSGCITGGYFFFFWTENGAVSRKPRELSNITNHWCNLICAFTFSYKIYYIKSQQNVRQNAALMGI